MSTRNLEQKIEVVLRGGIGNQIFQYFAGLEISIKNNLKLQLDDSFILEGKKNNSSIHSLNIDASFKTYQTHPSVNRINRYSDAIQFRSVYLNRLLANVSGRNIIKEVGFSQEIYRYKPDQKLLGYFQTWRHFDFVQNNRKSELLKSYGSIVEKFTSADSHGKNLDIAIHVRRGDYVSLQKTFGLLNKKYYQDALNALGYDKDSEQVYIFTDATKVQLEGLFNLAEMNAIIIDTRYKLTDIEQLVLMSNFRKIVIANSSYSWWGATLSKDETLIASPKNWYRSMPKPIDLIPENWVQIENSWL